jgi:hypothetical protein
MNRGLDEVVADLLLEIDQIKDDIEHFDKRMDVSIKRMNFAVKRLVKIESLLEDVLKRVESLEKKNKKS